MAAPTSTTPHPISLSAVGTPPVKLLDAAVAGDGTITVDFGRAFPNWGLQVSFTSNPSAVKVELYLSMNGGANWFLAGTWDSATPQVSGDIVWFTGKAGCAAYAKVATLTGGTAPKVTATVCASI